MKVFINSCKYNFVDENNVFVGYDESQSCCEYADFVFSLNFDESVDYTNEESIEFDCSKYVFDATYCKELSPEWCENGGVAVFKLVSKSDPDVYLILYNCHNGYYGHGFEMKKGDNIIFYGCL